MSNRSIATGQCLPTASRIIAESRDMKKMKHFLLSHSLHISIPTLSCARDVMARLVLYVQDGEFADAVIRTQYITSSRGDDKEV